MKDIWLMSVRWSRLKLSGMEHHHPTVYVTVRSMLSEAACHLRGTDVS